MIQQNIYSPDQGTQKNPGNSAFVSKLDPALKQLGSSMKHRSKKLCDGPLKVVETEEDQRTHGRGQLRRSWET